MTSIEFANRDDYSVCIGVGTLTELAARASSHPFLSAEEHCHAFVCLLASEMQHASHTVAAALLNMVDPARSHSAHTYSLLMRAVNLVDQDFSVGGAVTCETVEFLRAVQAIAS
jgi:hypothetical protein